MALERTARRPRGGAPEPDRLVIRCRRDQLPSGENTTALTESKWPLTVAESQNLTVLSCDADAYQFALWRAARSILYWLGSHRFIVGRLEERRLLASIFDKETSIRFEAIMRGCIVTCGRDSEL
jgi:hypothetical protein